MTTEFYLPGRNHRFVFYDRGPGNSAVVTGFTLSHPFYLNGVRITLSGSMVSVIDIALRLSCGINALHNGVFFSQAMIGLSKYYWAPSQELFLLSDDHLIFSVIVSAVGSWGIFAHGWAVVEP